MAPISVAYLGKHAARPSGEGGVLVQSTNSVNVSKDDVVPSSTVTLLRLIDLTLSPPR